MPIRHTPIVKGHYYHIYNKASHSLTPFAPKEFAEEFIKALNYYTQSTPPSRLSQRSRLGKLKAVSKFDNRLVDILAYCIMPDHFHLLLQQLVDNGISTYLRRLQNSFARLYNYRTQSRGSLFQGNFRAEPIINQEQLLYLSRYIHLNPVTAELVTNPLDYPFSSLHLFTRPHFSPPFNPSALLEPYLSPADYLIYLTNSDIVQAEPEYIRPKLIDHV